MSNPVLEDSPTPVEAIDAAAKKVSKPLWVIAICASISTLFLVLAVAYGTLQYVSLMNAMSARSTPAPAP